jgi:hypothetical protein
MSIELVNCAQGSVDWFEARRGVPTASEFKAVMSKGRGSAPSQTRRTYLLKLLGEKITGVSTDDFEGFNRHMERGHEMEGDARRFYALTTDEKPLQIGFIRNTSPFGVVGCSPDSTIGTAGLLEIKTKLPHLQLELLLADELPAEHLAQVQGQLWVAERDWLDFLSYWPGMKPFLKRYYRDEAYIATLKVEVEAFQSELAELHERYNRIGETP